MNEQEKKVLVINQGREITKSNDTTELQNSRKSFLDKMEIFNYNPNIKTFEMYPYEQNNPLRSKPEDYQYFKNTKLHNTRLKTQIETCCEIDKLTLEQAITLQIEIIKSLIRANYHFYVFYCEGGRSVHIRIYDFEEMKSLSPFQRIKCQIAFWRKHFPFSTFQYCDVAMFEDNHPLCLEYAIHWKHGTPFNLLLEWIPNKEEKCKS